MESKSGTILIPTHLLENFWVTDRTVIQRNLTHAHEGNGLLTFLRETMILSTEIQETRIIWLQNNAESKQQAEPANRKLAEELI